ncbi:group II intron maturase-specific domain-containing protein [Paraburkholderia sediminicola]
MRHGDTIAALNPVLSGWTSYFRLDSLRSWKSANNGRDPWWNASANHMNAASRQSHVHSCNGYSPDGCVRGQGRPSAKQGY